MKTDGMIMIKNIITVTTMITIAMRRIIDNNDKIITITIKQ